MAQPTKREPVDEGSETSQQKVQDAYPEFLRRLTERRDDLIGRTGVERSHLDEQLMTSPGDAADVSVIDTSADYFLKLANTHQHELIEIRDALDRMQRGAYGTCENCDNPIALERLRRLPYARMCIDCQSAHEKVASRIRPLPKL